MQLSKVSDKHMILATKILSNEKYWRKEVFKNNPDKMNKKVKEIEFLEDLVKHLWEDREKLIKQPKIL